MSLSCIVLSCVSTKKAIPKNTPTIARSNSKDINRPLKSRYTGSNTRSVERLLNSAEKFIGTPYKLGGTDNKGIDCSGLVLQVFEKQKITLPRNSSAQAQAGDYITIEESQPGDLLFFATTSSAQVSHVGIVHTILPDGEITFLHASTSKGVIISSLNERYWNKAFLFAKRLINN